MSEKTAVTAAQKACVQTMIVAIGRGYGPYAIFLGALAATIAWTRSVAEARGLEEQAGGRPR